MDLYEIEVGKLLEEGGIERLKSQFMNLSRRLDNIMVRTCLHTMDNGNKMSEVQDMEKCNLVSCRYNENGKCENEEKRKECVEVSRAVLCLDKNDEPFNQWKSVYDKEPIQIIEKMRNMSSEELFKARLQEPICKE